MYQTKYLPIKELNELILNFDQQLQNYNDTSIFDIVAHTEAHYVSELLLQLDLKSPKLTRDFVKRLHTGDVAWKILDGSERFISQDFDFEILEELGIIYFENDWLKVSARLLDSRHDEYIHESVKPVLLFARSLKEILYSTNKFQPIEFGIDKSVYSSIVPDSYRFKKISLNIEERFDYYKLDFSEGDREFSSLISSYYWKKILKSSEKDCLLKSYDDIKMGFSDLVSLPSEKVLTLEEGKVFSNVCLGIIENSTLLNLTFKQFQNILRSHRSFDSNLIATRTSISINIGPLDKESKSTKDTTTRTSITIDEIRSNYNLNIKNQLNDNMELIDLGNHLEHLIFLDSDIVSALLFIVKKDLFFDYQKIVSREITESLLDKSIDSPTMRHYLLNVIPNYLRDNTYDLYLLSRSNEFEIGTMHIIQKVKTKYNSNEISYIKTKSNISSILANIILKVSISGGKEHELVSLLVTLAKGYISDYRDEIQFERDLVEEIVQNLSAEEVVKVTDALIEKLKSIEVNGVWPNYTLYLLFLFSNTASNMHGKKVEEVVLKLSNEIYLEYERCFNFSLIHDSHCLNSNVFYDSLNWDACNNTKTIDDFINLKPSTRYLINGFYFEGNRNSIYFMQSIRSYFQVMMNLHSLPKANKNKIQSMLLDIVKAVGFKSPDVEFPLFVSHFSDEKYDLWDRFSKIVNDFDEYSFDEIVLCISESAPLVSIMSLYSNAAIQKRKDKLTKKIEKRLDWKLDKDNLPAIEKSFLLALEGEKLEIAKVSLDAANNFIKTHPWRENKEFKKIIDKWSVFDYKYKVLSIFYSPKLSENKIELINEISEPNLGEKKMIYHVGDDWHKEVFLFKRYILGLLVLKDNPDRARATFEQLYLEHKSSMFSHLVFTSKLQGLIKDKSDNNSYKYLIKEYISSQDNFDIDTLPLNNKSDYLYALLLSGNYNEVDTECSKLVPSEKFYRPITITFSKALREKNNFKSALTLLDNYKSYHSIELDDQELKEELKSIEIEIENSTSQLQFERIKSQVLCSDKTIDELKVIYNEIVRKPVHELAKIVSNNSQTSVESFLYNNVLSCLKEILKRGRNLEKLIKNKDENAINDWFTSLFNQKMSNFSISLSDQARIGSAESDKNVGETDGLIVDSYSSSLSIFEALNLKNIDKTIINKHLNKITKYDRESVSPVFIVSYCYFLDFSSRIKDYCSHIKNEQYDGFDEIFSQNHQLKELDIGSEYYCMVELRSRGGKQISIYHMLIDLTLPQPKK
ncbi:hypothetical protein CTM96_12240 [Photobacterium phosphoreum]|uniref:Uncharacterized protein n=2 Tax=Photobacterium phosphoreum TaxID=659 RepID=A0A2T3JPX9_PHOPO|nr:hypothetical protein [Photobacterium phosphoreum]PSU24702.1 hypothetical protein CTM96_12240 [Photobacterium phosphoreum]PSU51124.1 hypothetical protein C9J18_13090 [Photobacterium phosphoreum]